MNPRSTGILLLIALALGAFLWFYELGGEADRLEREEAGKRLFAGLEADQVDWIALTSRDGKGARFERRGAEWWMLEPVEFPAAASVERMADALASLTHEARFEQPGPDAEYGLDAASALTVRFGAAGQEHALALGRDTPVGSNRYARADADAAVYSVASYRTTAFDADLDDWRDADILDFDMAAVREVEASWPGGRVVGRRVDPPAESGEGGDEVEVPAPDSEWQLLSPLEARGDADTFDELLATLAFLRGDGFIDAPGPAQQSLFEPADFSVALRLEGAAVPRQLDVSRADADDRRLVRVAGRSTWFAVPADRIGDFAREVVAYRHRELSRFALTDAAHVDLYFREPGGDPVVIRAQRGDTGWTSEPEAFAPGVLSRLVSELSRLEADDVLAESMGPEELAALGLAPPSTVISVFAETPEAAEGAEPPTSEKLAEVHLGRVTPEGIAARSAGRDVVFRLSVELAEHIPVSLDDFRSRFRAEEVAAPEAAVPGEALLPPSAAEESP